MTNYDPALESQKFSAEVLQNARNSSNALEQRASEGLAGSLQGMASRKQQGQQFQQTLQQRQGEFDAERQDRAQSREQQDRQFQQQYQQQQDEFAHRVRQDHEMLSLRQKQFERDAEYAAIQKQVQMELLERAKIENEHLALQDERASVELDLQTKKAVLQMQQEELRDRQLSRLSEQAAGMTMDQFDSFLNEHRDLVRRDLAPGEQGPQGPGAFSASEVARGADSARLRQSLSLVQNLAKSIADMDPAAAAAITGIGLRLASGEIKPAQADAMIRAHFDNQQVDNLDGKPMDSMDVAAAIEKMDPQAREIHSSIGPDVPLGSAARIKVPQWIAANRDELVMAMASLVEDKERTPNVNDPTTAKVLLDRFTKALSPTSRHHEAVMSYLFKTGVLSQSDLKEYSMMLETLRQDGMQRMQRPTGAFGSQTSQTQFPGW